jgi:signal transduction histidine kinase
VGYDSIAALPPSSVPAPSEPAYAPARVEPLSATFSTERDSGTDLHVEDKVVAVTIGHGPVRSQVLSALRAAGFPVGGPDLLKEAALVIAEVNAHVREDLAQIRTTARPDTAILMVLATTSGEVVADARAAGAFACLRAPFVDEEVLSLVTAALDSRAAKVQVADLTRKLDLESHLASIGRISAGLSHEIGNPLGVAALNLETIRSECARMIDALKWLAFAPPGELQTRLEVARSHISAFEDPNGLPCALKDMAGAHARMQSLLQAMRGLVGRQHEPRRERVEVLEMVRDVKKWLKEELLGVEVEIIGEPIHALADPTLLGQILQNLTANAAHAAKSLSAPRVRLHVYESGERVVVSVRDNGPGIPMRLQDRIFEPFYTTRRGRGGTGLGLALCREYALQMSAQLSCWSVPGRGACFRVRLPRAD